MKTVWADSSNKVPLSIAEVAMPQPGPSQMLVKVHAFSLNAGDTRTALSAPEPYAPGWDFAGVVETAAVDGTSPPVGTRVVGVAAAAGWAEYVVSSSFMATTLPDNVSFVQAAALPVAASTAYVALELAGDLKGKRVLVTGASGGVGRVAIQIAARAGAVISAVSRRASLAEHLAEDGVTGVTLHADIVTAAEAGPYDYILDSVGGDFLGHAMTALAPNGLCVNCGNSSDGLTTFDVRQFYLKNNVRLHGLYLGSHAEGVAKPLSKIVEMVASGALTVPVAAVRDWHEIGDAAAELRAQKVDGKMVLTIA